MQLMQELPTNKSTFLFKHTLDLKNTTHVSPNVFNDDIRLYFNYCYYVSKFIERVTSSSYQHALKCDFSTPWNFWCFEHTLKFLTQFENCIICWKGVKNHLENYKACWKHVENFKVCSKRLKISRCVESHAQNLKVCWKKCWKYQGMLKTCWKFQSMLKTMSKMPTHVEDVLKIS